MTVINIKDAPSGWQTDPSFVYIGRSGKGIESHYGNPFKLEREEDRAEILVKYAYWLSTKIQQSTPESAYVPWTIAKLAHKTLVCFCAPKPCHGDILMNVASILNQYE